MLSHEGYSSLIHFGHLITAQTLLEKRNLEKYRYLEADGPSYLRPSCSRVAVIELAHDEKESGMKKVLQSFLI